MVQKDTLKLCHDRLLHSLPGIVLQLRRSHYKVIINYLDAYITMYHSRLLNIVEAVTCYRSACYFYCLMVFLLLYLPHVVCALRCHMVMQASVVTC